MGDKAPSAGASGSEGRNKARSYVTLETKADQEKYLDTLYASRNALTSAQETALASYKNNGYHAINAVLRNPEGGTNETVNSIIANLQSSLIPLPDDITLYRGMKVYSGELYPFFFKDSNVENLIGATFEEKGFSSTSVNKESGFMRTGNVRIAIRTPRGTKGIVPNPLGDFGYENEIILKSGLKYRIAEATKSKSQFGDTYLDLVVDII